MVYVDSLICHLPGSLAASSAIRLRGDNKAAAVAEPATAARNSRRLGVVVSADVFFGMEWFPQVVRGMC